MRLAGLLLLLLTAAAPAQTTFLGVSCEAGSSGPGVRIDRIIAGSAAQRAGLSAGDRILSIDGGDVADYDALLARIRGRAVGEAVLLVVECDGQRRYVVPVLGNEDRPGFEPVPLADPLLECSESLADAGARAAVEGRPEESVDAARALDDAIARHLPPAVRPLDEVVARVVEDRARTAQELARWFADRATDVLPVAGDLPDGDPSPVDLEVVAADPLRFAVRLGTLLSTDRTVTALRRRAGRTARVVIRLSGRDRLESEADLAPGDRLEWVERDGDGDR